jgi:hypothetical protein
MASSGASWATGRPEAVMIVRSPAAARRIDSASAPRSSRTPSRRLDGSDVSTGVHKQIRGTARKPVKIAGMNFAFTDEQEELRKTVR